MKYMRIGIAGYMGAGKTTCSRYLAERYQMHLIDADNEAKRIMAQNVPLHRELAESFGEGVIDNGTISFTVLGGIVFGDIMQLRRFNSIVHPLLLERLQETIFSREEAGRPLLIDAALLPLWKVDDWFDFRIWVDAPFDVRFERQMRKGLGINRNEVEKRMRLQETLFDAPSPDSWKYVTNQNGFDLLYRSLKSMFCNTIE
jgi:dephospho-CoA kinase